MEPFGTLRILKRRAIDLKIPSGIE